MPVKVCWVLAAFCAVLGLAAGLVTSTVSPEGQPIACGPALFHNWVELPNSSCALAYQPFQTIATVLLVGSLILAVVAIILGHGDTEAVSPEKTHRDPTGPSDRLHSR
jgi:hypothetical protein